MYKLLIVDDEELVRNAVIKKLDWTDIGFDLVEQAEDGEQALEIALNLKPDVVLTDVRMPFMDGLELSERLSHELPYTKIILLSGHDEFEYVQKAIKIGVLDYILKPIHSANLTKLLKKVKAELDTENAEKEKLLKLKNQLHQSLPLLKERFFNSLINNSINEKELEKQLGYLEITFWGDSFIVCVSEIDNLNVLSEANDPEYIALLNFSILNIISELIGSAGVAFNDFYNRQIIIFSGSGINLTQMEEDIYNKLLQIKENIGKYLKITVSIGIGSIANNVKNVNTSYNDALFALDHKIILGKNKIFNFNDSGYKSSNLYFPIDKINALLSRLKLESVSEITKCLDNFFKELAELKNITSDNIKVILFEVVSGIQKILIELKSESDQPYTLDFNIYNDISKYDTLEDLKVVILKFIINTCKYISTFRNMRNLNIVEKAKQCINDNYYMEELSLNYIAGIVSVSPGYLSILFKKETGENFVEYITRTRMEKAKELLKTTDMKAYEVAYKVGYSDPHYFSISFKKYTGFNPSDYKSSN